MSVRMHIQSLALLSVLIIQHCHNCTTSCTTWGSRVAVVAAYVCSCSCSSKSIPQSGNFHTPQVQPFKKKKKKKKQQVTSVEEDVEMGTLTHCWQKCKWMQPQWKMVRKFLKIFTRELSNDTAFPLLGIYQKKTKTVIRKGICTLCSLWHY